MAHVIHLLEKNGRRGGGREEEAALLLAARPFLPASKFASEVGDAFEGIPIDLNSDSSGFPVESDSQIGQLGLRMTWRSGKEVGKRR